MGGIMKKIALVGAILSLVLIFSTSAALAIGLEAAVGIWRAEPSGDMGYKGELLNVGNELKYDAKTNVFGRIKIDMPLAIPNIYLMATPMKFEGDGSKNINFTFGDKTFTGNVPFSSSVKLDHYDVALYYGLPFLKTATLGKFNVEIGLNARIMDWKAEINQPGTGTSESKSFTLPVPMIYLGAQLKPIKYFSIEAEARGIAYSSNHYYDLIGRLKVQPIWPVFIAGGYRYEDVKIDQSDVKANVTFKGPFLELGFAF
jgi:outer membrane protein